MANMEILRSNYINTTSAFTLDADQTATIAYIFDKNIRLGFSSSGYNSTTATTINASFSTARVISHVLIQNHNLKNFSVYYNGTTTNSLFSTTTNSMTSTYISFASITVSSIHLLMNDTIQGSVEKRVGEFVVTERQYVFERNPPKSKFMYASARKQVEHEMPDGGLALFNIRDKYRADIGIDFFSQTSYDTLLGIYEGAQPMVFVPQPTSTSWDGKAYPVVWPGEFNLQYSENVKSVGYSGSLRLREEASG